MSLTVEQIKDKLENSKKTLTYFILSSWEGEDLTKGIAVVDFIDALNRWIEEKERE
jgi:hypothetical protein